eukprot:GEMP01000801.1.p1 GENE.GEMP01000801.1~~GEMP01000801.1.p1  ORF type:complete len:1095 (+),score=286.67 GEMP01000801.1:1174-4458(+)
MHYFAKKRVLNSGDGTCTARRLIRSLPPIVMWHLKRGEYDPEGIPDTYFEFPRRIDMARYVERRDDADLNFVLYAVVVEVEPSVGHERRYYAFLRPEMEGDKGQWYRFDDGPVNSVHAVSNATAMDASLGGEEWLCVNYLYGPGSVLTRPKSSRACLLCYIREADAAQLLKEPRLPKSKDKKGSEMRARSPMSAADEIANMRAESLIEELEQQELREQKKKQQKQKKKHKEKVKRKTMDKESAGSQMGQTAVESMSAVDSDSDLEQNPVTRPSSTNDALLAPPSGKKGHAVASTAAVSGNEAKKRSKQQLAHTPSAGSSSSPVPDGVDAEWKNGSSTAPLSSKRKEHPATPSIGSTPADSGGKSSSKQQSSANSNAIGSKESEKMKHRNATGTAAAGSTVASSSSAIGSRANVPAVAMTKKERKKKAAAEQEAHKDHPSTPAVGSTASSGKEETSNGKPPDTSSNIIVGKARTPITAAGAAASGDDKKASAADDKKGPQSGANIGKSNYTTFSPDARTSAPAQQGVSRANTTNAPAAPVKSSPAPKQQHPAKAPPQAELFLAPKETRAAKRVINSNATSVEHAASDSRTPATSHAADVRATHSTALSSSSPTSKTQNAEAWLQKTDASKSSATRSALNAAVVSLPKAKSAHGGVPNAVLPPKKIDESKNLTEAKNPLMQQATTSAKAAPIMIGAPKLPPAAKASTAAQAQAQAKAPTTSYATRAKASLGPNIQAKAPISNMYGKAPVAAIQPGVPVGAKSARVLPAAQGQTVVRSKVQGPTVAQMPNARQQEASASAGTQGANAGNAGGALTQTQPQSSHPSCSSSAEPGGWYPRQLLVDDASARIQFECQVCHRIVRKPVVLECAHLFCRGCLVAHGKCPTCQVTYGELVCLEQTRGGALALLHRVYSGLKLRCLYHPNSREQPWEELKAATKTCEWRGFLQDYARHLESCSAHQATLKMPMSELGEMQLTVDWMSDHTSPPIDVKAGSVFHISSFDESKQWAYAFAGTASGPLVGWLPGNILERKVYLVTYPYCATDGASGEKDCPNSEFISMELGQGVAVYHRQGNGWVYGATTSGATAGQVGWFPERCIA